MSRRDQWLRYLVVIWKYLKTGSCLVDNKRCLSHCLRTQDTGLTSVDITVDLMQLADMDSELANLIVCRPLEGRLLFQQVVHQMLCDNMDCSHVTVALRIGAATLPDFRWISGQQLRYSGLVKLRGVVLSVTATVLYTQKFRCEVCGAGLKEVMAQRNLSDKMLAEVMTMEYQNIGSQRTVAVVIRDALCEAVHLGQQYDFIATEKVNLSTDNVSKFFEVSSLEQVVELRPGAMAAHLPSSIQHLLSAWSDVPFLFLSALRFADQVSPPHCFLKLKLLLLISLVLTPEVPALHVLAVSKESQIVQRIMALAGRLASTTCTHKHWQQTLGVKVIPSLYPWAPYCIQAGSLLLASRGVCQIGELSSLMKICKQELLTALTENRVQVALESRHTGSLPSLLSLPFYCQIWGLTSNLPGTSTTNCEATSGVGTTIFTKPDMILALIDAFSLICQCDVSSSFCTDMTEDIASFILASDITPLTDFHSEFDDELSTSAMQSRHQLSLQDFPKYMQAARSCQSVMTVEAESLLTSYLLAARRARAVNCMLPQSIAVPLTAWNTLQALSHGLCRLCLRTSVLEEDAVLAILFYEEALSARHGMSELNVFPEPHLPAQSAQTYIISQLVPAIQKFHSRLLHFCGMKAGSEE